MVWALIIILLAAANVATAWLVAVLSRRWRQTSDEVVELQAMVDLLLLDSGRKAYFGDRHGIEYVLDPSKLPPPQEST